MVQVIVLSLMKFTTHIYNYNYNYIYYIIFFRNFQLNNTLNSGNSTFSGCIKQYRIQRFYQSGSDVNVNGLIYLSQECLTSIGIPNAAFNVKEAVNTSYYGGDPNLSASTVQNIVFEGKLFNDDDNDNDFPLFVKVI